MKVTIAVSVYNKEGVLSRCLRSVCTQTYEDIEIIVVDDGSIDGSRELIDKWSKKDGRIRVIHKENGGVSSARNEAIRCASGDYIIFADADDRVASTLVEKVVEAAGESKPDCIVYENYIVTERKKWICYHSDKIKHWYAGGEEFYRRMLGQDEPFLGTAAWNKAFKLDIIRKNNIRFRNQKIGEDMRFCLEYALVSDEWVRINEPLYYYFQNSDSVMHNFSDEFEDNIRIHMKSMEEFFEENGMYTELVGAIGAVQLRDCLSVCKNRYIVGQRFRSKYKNLRGFVSDDFYRERFLHADVSLMPLKYKLFYCMLRYKLILALIVLMWRYDRSYR